MEELVIDWSSWLGRIRPKFDKVILTRGWKYFKDGAVGAIQVEGTSIIKARASGSRSYKVSLDLTNFTRSHCSCPYGYYCKHMAAVLFEVAKQGGYDPEEFRNGDKQAPQKMEGEREVPISKLYKQEEKFPQPTDSCAMWQTYFHKQFGNSKIYNAFSLEEVCIRAWRELNKLADTWESTIRSVYDISVALYVIQLCNKLVESKAITNDYNSNAKYYVKRVLNHAREQLEATLQQMDVNRAYKQYGEHLKELSVYLTDICEHGSSSYLYDWITLYKLLWSQLFQDKDMMEVETARLRQLLSDPNTSDRAHHAGTLSCIHLDICKGDDENAWERAETEMFEIEPDDWFDYLKRFVFESQWDRLLAWLRWLKPKMSWNDHEHVNDFLDFWRLAGAHRDVEAEHREVMVSLLPQSYEYYAKYLVTNGEYQAWADLCLLLDLSTMHIDSAQLKLVEKANVRYLLPIYHQGVEAYMEGKNRPDYIQAVKLLKKLAAAYKKLKLTSRFEVYLAQIVKQYAKYRAFNEELRKGNIIP
ncbi:hypothetical protein A8709_05445 [Paenibacillus pectinilyticus]|uniref:SWIM-type domain-containing protein n=1 Tax=Paenibacillus pectinilyticus TaxID=512399 RepID=A0A1C0ZSS8_9BACL|nr:SWIM zinc finger family protein [Paenibacillus pectinilyticus]OCT11132.1 hypothetical protein A8709_05445 [Paenibacillus pectinilyticus]